MQGRREHAHDTRGQFAHRDVIRRPRGAKNHRLLRPQIRGKAKIGVGFVAGVRRLLQRADAETFFDVRRRFGAERLREGFGLQRRIAIGITDVGHFCRQLAFYRQIEESARRIPSRADDFPRDSMPDDGEKTCLAADFVHLASQVLQGGRRRSRHRCNVNNRKVAHRATSLVARNAARSAGGKTVSRLAAFFPMLAWLFEQAGAADSLYNNYQERK